MPGNIFKKKRWVISVILSADIILTALCNICVAEKVDILSMYL